MKKTINFNFTEIEEELTALLQFSFIGEDELSEDDISKISTESKEILKKSLIKYAFIKIEVIIPTIGSDLEISLDGPIYLSKGNKEESFEKSYISSNMEKRIISKIQEQLSKTWGDKLND